MRASGWMEPVLIGAGEGSCLHLSVIVVEAFSYRDVWLLCLSRRAVPVGALQEGMTVSNIDIGSHVSRHIAKFGADQRLFAHVSSSAVVVRLLGPLISF
jgi:hypothetical protein